MPFCNALNPKGTSTYNHFGLSFFRNNPVPWGPATVEHTEVFATEHKGTILRHNLLLGVATAALLLPCAAFAQSTGTIQFDDADIVVNGTKNDQVGGTKIPDSPKAKVELTGEFLSHETSGQTVLETINMLPGVSFTNNDPYGASGGTLTIRGFDASRIALTIDGVPLNDTGNYAIYSNQQLDPELIDQVNVVLGSTDIDSPTASASGSTVNYTSVTPTDKFGVRMDASVGDQNMMRVFGMVNTGEFTPWGTKAWFSASTQNYDITYTNRGKINKDQYNFKIYQPIGSNGDFVALAGNYNVNRNNNTPDFFLDAVPTTKDGRHYNVPLCQTAAARAGVADKPNACGADFVESFNPSNTGTLRMTSSFHLADNLVLTVDPTYWYTKANGGLSAVTASEQAGPSGLLGTFGSSYFFGKDLNGDGDTLDTVKLYAPSNTLTHRILVLSSLRWTPSEDQTFRINYTFDHGVHKQTGEFGYIGQNGVADQFFPSNDPITAANGVVAEKRNRLSYAILNEVSGEYRGQFLDDKLTVNVGVAGKFFQRDLNNYCFTTSATGGVNCVAGSAADNATYAALNPYAYNPTTGLVSGYAAPQSRNFRYNRVLPSAGMTYKFGQGMSLYASYSQGIQVPGTDNLYASFYTPIGVQNPKPEISHNFDAGFRYTTSKIQAQAGPWYTIFDNRLASSYDPIADITTYRNLGTVHRYGFDGSIAYRPVRELLLYGFGSYLKSKILNNVVTGACSPANVAAGASAGVGTCTTVGQSIIGLTADKRELAMPVYTLGGRAEVDIDPIEIGAEIKRTGRSYLNDQNMDLIFGGKNYGNFVPGYTVVNLDARVNMGWAGLNKTTYVQFNVTNLFDVLYINHFSSGISSTNDPFVYISPPRTFSATLNVQF